MTFKEKVHRHYLQVIKDKINRLQQILDDLKESGANETKSTAGDKHETALAMIQIEQANTRTQLQEVMNQFDLLEKINPEISATIVVNGSLIKTNRGYFFMSVALGKAMVDNILVIALSPQSPLGKKLLGLCVSEKVDMNGTDYRIDSIF